VKSDKIITIIMAKRQRNKIHIQSRGTFIPEIHVVNMVQHLLRVRLNTGVVAGEMRGRLAVGSETGEVAAEDGGDPFLFPLPRVWQATVEVTGEGSAFLRFRGTITTVRRCPLGGEGTVGDWRHCFKAQTCLRTPGPPFSFLSLQEPQVSQSTLVQPEQCPHPLRRPSSVANVTFKCG
jgi:hypothetical protein